MSTANHIVFAVGSPLVGQYPTEVSALVALGLISDESGEWSFDPEVVRTRLQDEGALLNELRAKWSQPDPSPECELWRNPDSRLTRERLMVLFHSTCKETDPDLPVYRRLARCCIEVLRAMARLNLKGFESNGEFVDALVDDAERWLEGKPLLDDLEPRHPRTFVRWGMGPILNDLDGRGRACFAGRIEHPAYTLRKMLQRKQEALGGAPIELHPDAEWSCLRGLYDVWLVPPFCSDQESEIVETFVKLLTRPTTVSRWVFSTMVDLLATRPLCAPVWAHLQQWLWNEDIPLALAAILAQQLATLRAALALADARGALPAGPRRRWLGDEPDPQKPGLSGDQMRWMLPTAIRQAAAREVQEAKSLEDDR